MFRTLIAGLVLFGTSVSVAAQSAAVRLHPRSAHVSYDDHRLGVGLHVDLAGGDVRLHPPARHRGSSGYYRTVTRKVWVPGRHHRVWVPDEYAWTYDDCGRRVRTLVHAGHYDVIHEPGRWEHRTERVWVAGRRGHHRHHRHHGRRGRNVY